MFDCYIRFPQIDPVALAIGPLQIRWYALAYVTGVLFCWLYCRWLVKRDPSLGIKPTQFDDLIAWAIPSLVIGGRLGYVLFYQLDYYLKHPLEIFMIWQGGMAFHGGIIGILVGFYIFSWRNKLMFLRLLDLVGLGIPMGIFLGRIANFINGELYGRITDMRWAVLFPAGGYLPRHPSQLYEALLEGLMILIVLNVLYWRTRIIRRPGQLAGIWLMLYALARFVVEFFREPDAHLGFVWHILSMGQLLSVPYLLLGAYLFIQARTEP
ncbi:MAG: prolipoprotein diacylglyceryl transferase [Rickettsiales bacterium]|nr:prolipoprotein diacylglyceryl transferase [Rickettsiales bacterium]|tara:strand:- start:3517 stop:4317 length:801 start_codon:yes stop_codon:yes gene_type:complete